MMSIIVVLSMLTAQPATSQAVPQVISFTLVNADKDIEISPLTNNTVIDCALLKTKTLNIRANTSPTVVGSVRFALDSNPNYSVENISPYFLGRNNGSDWNGWTPTDGQHTLTAIPYTLKEAGGTAGTPLTVTFSAASCSVAPTPTDPFSTPVPNATDTPTLPDTPEVTPIMETPAPGVTPTSIRSIELLKNGGFEASTTAADVPESWLQRGVSKDKRKCGSPTKIIASEGSCVYQFKSARGENSKLIQSMGVSGNPTRNLRVGQGDTLIMSGMVNAKGAVDVRVKVRVNYKGTNPPPRGKLAFRITTPTNGYQPLSGVRELPLAGEPDIIKVKIVNKGTRGKVRVDGMSLILDRPIGGFIPLP